MKIYRMYFFSPECGGIWQRTHVQAKNKKEAKKVVSNTYYVPERMVFIDE